MKLFGSSDIKTYVNRWIRSSATTLKNKVCIDMPAGAGVTSDELQKVGAQVEPYDLFPEFFKVTGTSCQKADLSQPLPIADHHADVIICQEGIEHISDQLALLKEFNRILKGNGRLILTTPNYSNLMSRVSYMLNESERYKLMPPNEIDSIWYQRNTDQSMDIYYGHIFMLGIHKLRLLASIAGFSIKKIHSTKANRTALLLFPFQYPFILLTNLYSYFRILKRHKNTPPEIKAVYKQQLKLGISPKILLDKYLFIEFEKTSLPQASLQPYFEYAQPPA